MKLPRVRVMFRLRADLPRATWGMSAVRSGPIGLYRAWTLNLGRIYIKLVIDRRLSYFFPSTGRYE